jgi:hypothetical protein
MVLVLVIEKSPFSATERTVSACEVCRKRLIYDQARLLVLNAIYSATEYKATPPALACTRRLEVCLDRRSQPQGFADPAAFVGSNRFLKTTSVI